MSEKGKNPSERSKGSPRKTQREQILRRERQLDPLEGEEDEQVEESLREKERKPNR